MSLVKSIRRSLKSTRGQGLVEYGILIGGVALVCLAAVSILGHKCNDLCATVAAVLPCAHEDHAAPIVSGKIVATTTNDGAGITLDGTAPGTFADNLGIADVGTLVIEP